VTCIHTYLHTYLEDLPAVCLVRLARLSVVVLLLLDLGSGCKSRPCLVTKYSSVMLLVLLALSVMLLFDERVWLVGFKMSIYLLADVIACIYFAVCCTGRMPCLWLLAAAMQPHTLIIMSNKKRCYDIVV